MCETIFQLHYLINKSKQKGDALPKIYYIKVYVVEIRYESVELIVSVRCRNHRRAVVYTTLY